MFAITRLLFLLSRILGEQQTDLTPWWMGNSGSDHWPALHSSHLLYAPTPLGLSKPACLSFTEHLKRDLRPSDIVIFTGGDSFVRRTQSYGRISAETIEAFQRHHGYQLAFLDQLDYDKKLIYRSEAFAPYWHRVFALPALLERFPAARYFVWLDDDIIVPYPETHMLNHYVNLMESSPSWQMTFAEEGCSFVLNSGMFIMKNSEFSHWVFQEALDLGAATKLKQRFGHEQEAIATIREQNSLQHQIRVISHRQGLYNFNSFARKTGRDPPGAQAEFGDAFVHFLGIQPHQRDFKMREWLDRVRRKDGLAKIK